jgi:hypothetical protein
VNISDEKPRGGTLVLALAVYAIVMVITSLGAAPPAPKSADAPADEFSAVRAKAVLQQLVGNGVPHPVGSAANAAVRDGIVAQLKQLGYQPRVQEDFVCDDEGGCGDVRNILARLDGQEPGPAVMVASHYDSVPAGPGASDDGAGTVSVLEIARALKASPTPRHPVIFLIDEGEEAGLFGAVAFVQDDPWAKDVRAVVNMDNRGTSGPATMFETGSANEWVMRTYAKSVHHPNSDSLSYTVYKSLPNDTDFTVFKHAGYQGLNFAFLDDVAHYHTPLDNVANTSVASIQSEGGSAFDAVRALANSGLNFGQDSDAVYQDLLGWKMIWWPARWTMGFALLALMLVILEIAVLLQRGAMQVKGFFLGLMTWPLILIVGAILGIILQFFLRAAGALPANWVAHPAPLLTACWALGFGAVAFVAAVLGRSAGFWGIWSGIWTWWGIVALVLGVEAAGLSFVFVVPALSAGIFGLAVLFAGRNTESASGLAVMLPIIVTAIFGVGMVWSLYVAMGNAFVTGITLCVALIAAPLAPLAGAVSAGRRWRFSAAAFAVAVIATVVTLIVPRFSAASPETLDLQYHQDADTGKSQWLAFPASGHLPTGLQAAASFAAAQTAVYPWDVDKPLAADAPALNLPAPTLTIQHASSSQGESNYEVLVKSARGAPVVLLAFAPDVTLNSVSMMGHSVPQLSSRMLRYTHGWRIYRCEDTPPGGIEMKFTISGTSPVSVFLLDESFGLPPQGMSLAGARPSTTIPIQNGDTTVITRHVTLKPQ